MLHPSYQVYLCCSCNGTVVIGTVVIGTVVGTVVIGTVVIGTVVIVALVACRRSSNPTTALPSIPKMSTVTAVHLLIRCSSFAHAGHQRGL